MGYRNYIGRISKAEHAELANLNRAEFLTKYNEDPKNGYVGAYNICEELYELGKYIEFGEEEFFFPFFENKELHEYYNTESEFVLVTKEYLAHIIKYYKDRVSDLYKNLLDGINLERGITPEKARQLFDHIYTNSFEWEEGREPYNLERGDACTDSWKYEYSIFELVRIYKAFDWENDYMTYYGY